jgi:LPXTG-site transpeptidase (sortase) family protein
MNVTEYYEKHVKKLNTLLFLLILVINAYIIVSPLAPAASYQIKVRTVKPIDVTRPEQVAAIDTARNHLIIPALRLDEPILDGTSPYLVHKGIWRRPNSSQPDKGSNTVLVGHRFTYDGASVFYNLDKVKAKDDIIVAWKHRVYTYKVNDIRTVPASKVSIEDKTDDDRLTIYTCTPLWSARDRLVVTASLVENAEKQ